MTAMQTARAALPNALAITSAGCVRGNWSVYHVASGMEIAVIRGKRRLAALAQALGNLRPVGGGTWQEWRAAAFGWRAAHQL